MADRRRLWRKYMARRRPRLGRLTVYLEPRDLWIGLYVAPAAVYVCPLPLLVFRWARGGAS